MKQNFVTVFDDGRIEGTNDNANNTGEANLRVAKELPRLFEILLEGDYMVIIHAIHEGRTWIWFE